MSGAIVRLDAKNGGEGGIRTPGTFQFNGFQDRRIRPLCHLSMLRILSAFGQSIYPKSKRLLELRFGVHFRPDLEFWHNRTHPYSSYT